MPKGGGAKGTKGRKTDFVGNKRFCRRKKLPPSLKKPLGYGKNPGKAGAAGGWLRGKGW